MKTIQIHRLWLLLLLLLIFPLVGIALPTDDGDKEKTFENDPVIKAVRAYSTEQINAGGIKKDTPNWKSRLPKFPTVEFPAGSKYIWNLKTSQGDIEVEFLPEVAPNHVANFIYLTELGFFDGLGFHRVISRFMAQGGCPKGTGRGNPGYRFAGEYDSAVKHNRKGLLSMANAGPNTDGSQFFLTFVPTPWLDGKHTIFGVIRKGDETMEALEKRGSKSGRPSEKLFIEKATISVESETKTKKEAPKKEKQ